MSSSAPCVLLAPDKFKASASAAAVVAALADGVRHSAPGSVVIGRPIADGGDGTVDVLLHGGYRPMGVPAADVLGRPRVTVVATRGGLAVIELASTCGLAQLGSRREPLRATSLGLGVALREVLAAGFRDVVLGLGGSASTDGGLGLLTAMGARGLDVRGRVVPPDGAGLLRLTDLDVSGIDLPVGVRIRLACDVVSPMHGPAGAATVFGPQKGASPTEVASLDAALVRLAGVLRERCGADPAQTPGAGAAGAVAGAAIAALGAEVVDGAVFVLTATGFDEALATADLVVTGEGSWDAQSLLGKGPGEVVRRARQAGVPAVVVAGQIDAGSLDGTGVVMGVSLAEVAGSVDRAIVDVLPLLRGAGVAVGELLLRDR
ncbi:glycerate kinase [Cellulomonas sp. KRMCY2]|uniref:glycerate kinase n=1 Tax=Cellulomonas sp. KRMCY2 TaxID=1304865 RepID=UPI00045E7F44|nr:glycerate kinase [Cellulomonas sp. KRMCY2]